MRARVSGPFYLGKAVPTQTEIGAMPTDQAKTGHTLPWASVMGIPATQPMMMPVATSGKASSVDELWMARATSSGLRLLKQA
jgi:hypothetical protein